MAGSIVTSGFPSQRPSEKVLNLSTHFGVKEISQNGIIIQTNHQLKIDSMVLMELSFNSCDSCKFYGENCFVSHDPGSRCTSNYDIGVEFSELIDLDMSLLISFIDCFKKNNKSNGEGAENVK